MRTRSSVSLFKPTLVARFLSARALVLLLWVGAALWVSACGTVQGAAEKVGKTSEALAADASADASLETGFHTAAMLTESAAGLPYWQVIGQAFPNMAREAHAMAYDSARSRVVLFGGFSYLGDTWEWDGKGWTQRATTGPAGRFGHKMAYDSARGKVVMFGGVDAGANIYSDTWEWDGMSWTQVATTGPTARYDHAIAYDSTRHKVVLFGGNSGHATSFGDTWEWDGTRWTQIAVTSGPSARNGHAMAYDSARGQVVLFGGTYPYPTDTWAWDGASWTKVATSGPSARFYHGMAFDGGRSKVVLFGGATQSSGFVNDTWEWNGSTWTQVVTTGPAARESHAMVYDTLRHETVLFGGRDAAFRMFGDTWTWNGTTWTQSSLVPGPRYGHGLAYDAAHGKSVMFGGFGSSTYFGDTWGWDGAMWTQLATSGPPARTMLSTVYDSGRGRVVLFGGSIATNAIQATYGDTWEWDGASWAQRSTTGPSPRYGQAMAYDSARHRVVLFGGGAHSAYAGDTWEWDGTTWTQRATTGPSPRQFSAMAYDAARGKVVLFGGFQFASGANNGFYADTWEWDGTTWTQVASTGPSPRQGHQMVYQAARSKIVLIGGSHQDPVTDGVEPLPVFYDDTWEWDGTSWSQVATTNPSTQEFAAAGYDSARGAIVLYGGYNLTEFGDTWETPSYGASCTSNAQCAYGSCVDGVCCNTAAPSCGQCQACNVAGSVGMCSPTNEGATCSTANACMRTKVCQTGSCTESNPVVCTAMDQCHVAGTCDPSNGTCPTPSAPDGTICNDNNACTTADTCQTGTCMGGAPLNCDDGNPCTVDSCDPTRGCVHTAAPAGVVCRAAVGACDLAEVCDGTSNACPADTFLPSTTTCRAAAGACDLAEQCTGSSADCPPDVKQPSTTACRPAAGSCDVAEICDGVSNDCPADTLLPSTTTCRPAADVCDVAEQCTGVSPACPADAFSPSTTMCRPAAGVCDVAELCTGAAAACPQDMKRPSTTTCRPAAGVCDVAEACDGASNDCPADAMQPSTFQCRAPTCTSGTATQAAFCGSGPDCPAPATSSCGLFVCGASACTSTCTSIDQCVPSAFCSGGACLLDTDPPVVTVGATPAFTNQVSLVVTGTVRDNGAVASVRLRLNGSLVGGALVPDASGNVSAPAVTLTEGNNTFTLEATDRAGNVGATQGQIVLDTKPPALVFKSPQANQAIGMASVDVAVQVTEQTPATVSIGGGPNMPAPSGTSVVSATLTMSSSGVQAITATATDAAGNTASISEPVLIDLAAPDVTIDVLDGARLGPLVGNVLPVTLRVNDVGATTLTLSTGGSFQLPRGGGIVQTTVPLVEGTDNFLVTVTNEASHTAQLMRTVIYDLTPPTAAIVIPQEGSFARGTIDLSVDATDALTGVASASFTIDGSSPLPAAAQSGTSTWIASFDTKTLADGAHTATCVAVDGVGNGRQVTSHFVVDNSPPTVGVTAPPAYVHSSINLTATAADATSGVASLSILVNGTSIGSCANVPTCTLPFDTATLPDGAFGVAAAAVDGAGNTATSAPVISTAVNGVPSNFIVSPIAGSVQSGSSMNVAVNVSDAYFVSVECFFNGVSLGVSSNPAFSQTVSLSNVLDGPYAVTCQVLDKAGNVATQSVNTTVQRWTLEMTPRAINLNGRAGTVSASVTGADVSILSPIAGRGLALIVPGGSPVPAVSGGLVGNRVSLVFDRGLLVQSIEAGIAVGKIDPSNPVVVQLYAGTHAVDSDLVRVTP